MYGLVCDFFMLDVYIYFKVVLKMQSWWYYKKNAIYQQSQIQYDMEKHQDQIDSNSMHLIWKENI